jgi:hypothetical protein
MHRIKLFSQEKIKNIFWDKIQKTESCWIWDGSLANNGYGHIFLAHRTIGAHVFSYLIHKGEIIKGNVVMHSCDNKICVNPNHLSSGTQSENIKDCFLKNRANRRRYGSGKWLKCKKGHDVSSDKYLYINPKNQRRECLKCKNDRRKKIVARSVDDALKILK